MSFGFEIRNSSDILELSSNNYGFSIVDKFDVAPSSSGNVTYEGLGQYNLIISQSSVEPVSIDKASLLSFNAVSTSVTTSGNNKIVSWSPLYNIGNTYNVTLFIMVM
jgi:hypothetical protein